MLRRLPAHEGRRLRRAGPVREPGPRGGRVIRPVLGVTMGDAAGVGPEIIARAADEPEVARTSRPVVIGSAAAMREALALVGARHTLHTVTDVAECRWEPDVLEVL